MSDRNNEIAKKIKKYRKVKNMSQEMLAEASGIHISMIKKYESGIRNPKPDQLLKIANALEISINALQFHNINTISDVITILINLDEQTALNITGEKDESGKYIPDSIYLSFDDDKINKVLSKYLAYKDGIAALSQVQSHTNSYAVSNELEKAYLLTELIASDITMKRPGVNDADCSSKIS